MALERIILNIIPAGEMPVFHCSQFENGRPVIIDLISSGDDAYIVPEGVTVELHCRKCDDTIVTMEPDEVDNNTVTFVTSEQLTACPGDNLCELVLYSDTDPVQTLATLNFILHVEPDPLAGGLTSESEIYNLTQQIEDIAQEVIGEDYYNKTEVDALLSAKADSDSVYTKGETDTLLSAKADSDSVYTKGETDTLLSAKADSDDVYTKSETYTQAEVDALIDNIFPTFTASGSIATFTTALNKPLVNINTEAGATIVTRCGVNLMHVDSRVSQTTASVTYTSDDNYIELNGTKYGGTYADLSALTVTLPAGTYYLKAFEISGTATNAPNITAYNGSDLTSNILNNERVLTLNAPTTFRFRFALWTDNAVYTNYKVGIIISTASISEYSEYTGITVPVSDAETITTLSGVNNIYADDGAITVQYKYMSM